MNIIRAISLTALACAVLLGCVRTPMHDGITNVPVDEVVRRLKCELIMAIDAKHNEDKRFAFLTQWAAKVHLTIVVDDTASINPGATFIEPLSIAGTNRSLAIGAGLTTQAVRTEDIEFFLSFPEMIGEMSTPHIWAQNYNYCGRDTGIFLESELGLKAIIDKALAPVGTGVLYTGKNNPGLGSGQPKIPAGEVANIQAALKKLSNLENLPHVALTEAELSTTAAGKLVNQLTEILREADKKIARTPADLDQAAKQQQDRKTLGDNLSTAKLLELDTKLLINEVVTPLFEIASSSISNKCQAGITADKFAAITSGSVVAIKKYGVDNALDPTSSTKLLEEERKAATDVYNSALHMLTTIKNCGPKEAGKPALYDPIDVIGETVNFYVTATGSLTPSWKLVRISAPLAPTFVSGTRKDTNTLILAMGRPNTSGGSAEASTAMNNQILSQILSQAITTRINQQ